MRINKNNIVRFTGSTIISAAILMGTGIALHETTFDHNKGICLLTKLLGSSHQIEAINNNQNNITNGISATYLIPGEYTHQIEAYYYNDEGEKIPHFAALVTNYPKGAILIRNNNTSKILEYFEENEKTIILKEDNILKL